MTDKVNKESLHEIIETYYDDIYRFCLYLTGSATDSYDITQDVFLKFITYMDSYRKENLKGYLLTIARNLCYDYFRKKKITSSAIEGDVLEEIYQDSQKSTEIEEVENKMLLTEVLQRIPAEQREVIVLRYYGELKLREIAKVLDCNLSTVKSRLRLGIKCMRTWMEELS